MDLGLAGKVAIVTGGSKGIGKAIAQELAGEGVDVAICARDRRVLEDEPIPVRGPGGRESGRVVGRAEHQVGGIEFVGRIIETGQQRR